MPLDDKQKSFIRRKVKRLGSIEKVRRNYRLEDLVSQYALQVAEEMFGTSKRPSPHFGQPDTTSSF